ncbi:MAG: PKD domain-containing protein [Candidatus Bathyarchaeia archaeon]
MFRRNKVVFLVVLIFSVTLLTLPLAATASAPPVASFTHTPDSPLINQIVIFNASASYDPNGTSIVSYRWDFGDGTIFTIPDPVTTHNYTTVGDYNVTLTVTDDEALTDTTWAVVTVRDYPVASFTYSPATPIVGETVTFNASLSTPNGGTITSYDWDFGDGNSANVNVSTTTHVYTTAGTYNVTLTVTDSENLTDTTWTLITVRDYPVASFTHTPDRPLVNENVTFDASSSTPNGGSITSYFWDFGDGSNGTGVIVTHAYATIGNYNVTLTVTDSESLTDTAWDILEVRKLPVATFTYSPAAPLEGETVTFNASLSTPNGGTIVSYTWDFGDGSSPVTEADPITTHNYTTFGTYNVTLNITDSEDLTDTYWDTIRILIAPTANFTYSPTMPVINQTVTFNASASYDPDGSSIVSYTWDFGDGSSPVTEADPITTHNYTAEGTYNVTLTVTDDDALTDTMWKLVTVYTFVYVHDVAIISVTASAEVYVGDIVNITVVVKNEGTAVETFSVTVYYNGMSVETKTVKDLLAGSEATLTFNWNTTGVTVGSYTISAQASVVSGETDTADNSLTDGIVKVKIMGDINGDGTVDIVDIVTIALAFGSSPGDPNWNPDADLNGDGTVDIIDIVMAAIHFGETW